MNLTKTTWPQGWNPSQDSSNGSSDALLRMDNLRQDDLGALTIIRGAQKLNPSSFGNKISVIADKNIDGTDYKWVVLDDLSVSILRSSDDFQSSTEIGSMGGDKANFGDCLGQVQICAGSLRLKDTGTQVENLGLLDPPAPGPDSVVNSQTPLALTSGGTWGLIQGRDQDNPAIPPNHGPDPNSSSAWTTSIFGGPWNCFLDYIYTTPLNTLDPGTGISQDPGTDTFSFSFRTSDITHILGITVSFAIKAPNGVTADHFDYNWSQPSAVNGFDTTLNATTTIQVQRSQFTRVGNNTTAGWEAIHGIIFKMTAKVETWMTFSDPLLYGGALGSLYGYYEYAQQDINDNGSYVAKSKVVINPNVKSLTLNGFNTITPVVSGDPQVTSHWIYRRSISSVDIIGTDDGTPDLLDDWYLVLQIPVGTASADDTMADVDAIEQDIIANLNLLSIQDITDSVIGQEGMFNERMLYLTENFLYLSDRLNPDAVDTRYTLKAFGDRTEKNLWIKKVTNNLLVLSTTKDFYAISGTLLDLPDGTIDANIQAIGDEYPALCRDVAAVDGLIFYVGATGLRSTNGSNSLPVGNQLDLLFQGEDRHGVLAVKVEPNNQISYPIAVGRGRVYFRVTFRDNTTGLFIYDTKFKSFRYVVYTDIVAIHITQKDEPLFGMGITGGNYFLRYFEKGTQIDSRGQSFLFRTIYDHNQQPRNRKDTFTLKVVGDTGGVICPISIAFDGGSFQSLGNLNLDGLGTAFFDLKNFALGFRYAIQISGSLVTTLRLLEITIEYDPRPEQLNHLRIPNTNLGTIARKRTSSIPFIIDTLGNSTDFTPCVDNVDQTLKSFSTATKLTHIHYFDSEVIGVDFGGVFDGGPFEYYGPSIEEAVYDKLPVPTTYLKTPETNLGSAGKKRIRTIPLVINTNGQDVTFVPTVDGATFPSATFNTTRKQTVYYYFISDVFGIDLFGTLSSSDPFEFFGYGNFEDVEVLPVPKKFDQIGPIRFDKIGKLFAFRLRLIATDTSLTWAVYNETSNALNYATPLISSTLVTVPNEDQVYEVRMPKNVNFKVGRLVFGPNLPFYRYDCQVKVSPSGMESDSKWIQQR